MEVSMPLGRVSLVPRGEYDPAAAYVRLDLVQYGGSGYLVLRPVQGVPPEDGEDYMLLARSGRPGEPGENGSSIASIARTGGNGAPGTTDTYTITLTDGGTSTFQVYNGADGTGSGDMSRSVYDPQNKNTDIFEYVDEKVKAANITVDETPTVGSDNPVSSGGVVQYMDGLIGDIGAILDSINGEAA